jgi:hypothetical protein
LLEREAGTIGGYLVGQAIPDHLVQRYVQANLELLRETPRAQELALLDLIHARPWTLPLIDTACALLDRRGLVRRKILIAAAILETCPEFATEFLPRAVGRWQLMATLAGAGLRTAVNLAGGIVLYAWLGWKVR